MGRKREGGKEHLPFGVSCVPTPPLRGLGPAPSSVTPGAWNPPPTYPPGPENRAHLSSVPAQGLPPSPVSAAPWGRPLPPDRWWGAQLVRYQPPPGASLSRSAAACLRLGPRRVIKRRPGPSPASVPSLLWPVGQVGTSDNDWGLQQFPGDSPLPLPLSGQEQGGRGALERSVPAQHLQGPPRVPTTLVLPAWGAEEAQDSGQGWQALSTWSNPTGEGQEAQGWWLCLWARAGLGRTRLKPTPPLGHLGGSSGRECSFTQGESDPDSQRSRFEAGDEEEVFCLLGTSLSPSVPGLCPLV